MRSHARNCSVFKGLKSPYFLVFKRSSTKIYCIILHYKFRLHTDVALKLHIYCIKLRLHDHYIEIAFYYITFELHFDYTRLQWCNWAKCNQIAIKTQCKILLHLRCSLIAFHLHFDCMKLLHFDCTFHVLHYDCKTITFILHFNYMSFGLSFSYTTIAILQLYCNKSSIHFFAILV
jgi:hypothetical protein